ncbi:MAG: glycosyltransferase family 2 protein [Bacteroidota bacterium]|jgi:glycosyltransferase involved in cell wall biosynthesis
MTLLSIITINYQNKLGLEKTINSVISQTNKQFEYIIIDGGSSDGSLETINNYKSYLKYWESQKDDGIYSAMNKGWKKASGQYCLFLNSGDYLYNENVLDEVIKCIDNCPADIVYGSLFAFDENRSFISTFTEPISLYYFQHSFIPHPATFIKKSLLENLNGFYEHYSVISDWAFFVRCFLNNANFQQVDIITTSFYMNGSSSNIEVAMKDKEALFNNEFKFLKQDFKNLERLRHFDTSIITRIARKVSSLKIKYFR